MLELVLFDRGRLGRCFDHGSHVIKSVISQPRLDVFFNKLVMDCDTVYLNESNPEIRSDTSQACISIAAFVSIPKLLQSQLH